MSPITPLKCTIGQPATGSAQYFERPKITRKIRRSLNSGSHILISAPRRIGKSSILKHFKQQAVKDDEVIIYLSVQSASNSNDFFHSVFKMLIKNNEIFTGIGSYQKRASANLKNIISRFRGVSLEGGVQIDRNESIHYYSECQNLINHFNGKKVVLLLDEFPDAVNNMIRDSNESAIAFLLEVRELRDNLSQLGLQFVFTGSSGLANVVSQLGRNDLIIDLDEIEIPPYSIDEASALIQSLVLGYQEDNADFHLSDPLIQHILNTLSWCLPYYLQIIIKELFEYFEDTEQIPDTAIVDQLLSEMIKAKSKHYGFFENWLLRLERSFDESTYLTAVEILNQLAANMQSSFKQINALSFPAKPTLSVKRILNVLEHDGYISENQQQYGFNSFLLKQWWLEHVAV